MMPCFVDDALRRDDLATLNQLNGPQRQSMSGIREEFHSLAYVYVVFSTKYCLDHHRLEDLKT